VDHALKPHICFHFWPSASCIKTTYIWASLYSKSSFATPSLNYFRVCLDEVIGKFKEFRILDNLNNSIKLLSFFNTFVWMK